MRFLKADDLFDGRNYLAKDAVLVLDNQNLLKEIVTENSLEKSNIEYLEGIITPGFVNVHCHLELSHLKNKIPKHTGLPAFAKKVVALRNAVSKEEISSHMQQANLDMWNNGIVAVGDISNIEDSFEEKLDSKIYYHTFIELIGLNPVSAPAVFEKGKLLLKKLQMLHLAGSLAPHAPYSTSKELIKQIADYNYETNQSLSIHNQESEEEAKFFEGKPNAFEDLYRSFGLDLSWYNAPGISSLLYYLEVLSEKPSILVHNTFTGAVEIAATLNKNIYWCFCPGANNYIENRLPDFSLFAKSKDRIVIGTDSLASNSQLNIVEEANLILERTSEFSFTDILGYLTFNGAEALGISNNYGQFSIGKNAGLNLVEFKKTKLIFNKKLA